MALLDLMEPTYQRTKNLKKADPNRPTQWGRRPILSQVFLPQFQFLLAQKLHSSLSWVFP